MKKIIFIYLLLVVVLGSFVLIKSGYIKIPSSNLTQNTNQAYVEVNNNKIKLLLAKTPQEQMAGLSNKDKLDAESGMLFVFKQKDYVQFWMKNMKFAIDMIYISDNKIVDVFQNLKPPSDQKSIQIYRPREKANFVLQINAGLAQKYKIKPGDKITLKNIK
ncbi:MAG: hypothetical protein A2857_02975 [Candidatus Levybacteria bacterium RIFCSPHIGHO2_01_FULL_36_15]|nr:MAG: hypothetical protein A2857_02975 [Candidatus Levybacteria bacterium RIFCSPHIGHO2_01_FULL_36_15]OGH37266.1 MAG: hypothetical protein A2905_05670 [Candidatus Levybacteria bacterium RIFCSPLOWO2_01_FULL_36_10]